MKLTFRRRTVTGRLAVALTGLAACLLVFQLAACSEKQATAEKKKKGGEGGAVPVVTALVVAKTVPVRIQAIGNVEPYATVAIKSRVDGQIVKVPFADGQDVTQGQILFQLDQRPFAAALQQAEANLVRDKAQRDRARTQKNRYQDLLQKNFISPDAYAQFVTNTETAEATVAASEAAVETARLQLEYATIRAPISGRSGKIMIQNGNLVKANDTGPLVILNQVAPAYLNFAVPEQYLGSIRKYMGEGKLGWRRASQLRKLRRLRRGGIRREHDRRHYGDGEDPRGVPEQGPGAVARPVRRRIGHAARTARCDGRPLASRPDRPQGDVRFRRQARDDRRAAPGGGRAHRR
jgi:multidrug efflux system membrane fusion protein